MSRSESVSEDIVSLPYLLFTVGKNIYGISSEFVRSIETLGEITTMAEQAVNVRGGLLYQGDFIYLVDMRRLFGLSSQIEEFERSVQPEQRIKDHENWVAALEKSVLERSEFTLADDPHNCAFGKWYYAFRTDNNVLKHQLKAIEAPHQAVHDTAKTIRELMRKNQHDQALATIAQLKATNYKTTLHLLSSLREIVLSSLKELYIVIDACDCVKGIIVDGIVGVEYLDSTLPMPPSMPHSKYIEFLGRRKNDDSIVIVINNAL